MIPTYTPATWYLGLGLVPPWRYEPELAGKVAVNFAVARGGDVRHVRVVQNTTGNPQVGRCVTRVVSTIRFQRRRTGKNLLRFTFPFVFAPQN